MTNAFSYQHGSLCAEQVALGTIAADVGTPFYAVSTQQLDANYDAFVSPFRDLNAHVHYALKANACLGVIRALARRGCGADITSVGELERSLAAGVPPSRIVFSGVGKRRDELMAALIAGIHQINVESLPELYALSAVAMELGTEAPIALRVNPDVDARTHHKTSTGHKETKFGVPMEQLDEALRLAASLPNLSLKGLAVHVGSHVYDFTPFREAYTRLADLVRSLRADGIAIERLDLGGGVGIPYDGQTLAPFADYAAIVREIIAPLGCAIAFEPGRRLVGDAAVLVTRVTYVKQTPTATYLVVDAGMNDLVRPAMYDARHAIVTVSEPRNDERCLYHIVGPVCETSDSFGDSYTLPPVVAGDLIAILQGGAYASSMASNYNGRPLLPEIMVQGGQYATLRRRIAVADQLTWEAIPFWLMKDGPL